MNYDIVLRVVDKTSAGLKKTEKSIEGVSSKARLAKGALIGVTAAIGGIVAAGATVQKTINSFDDLAKRARNVGAATEGSFENFQVIDSLLSEAGISAQETDRAFNNLNLRLADAQKGGAAYADAYAALGDSVLDANGDLKSAPDLFKAVGDAVQAGKLDLEDAADILGERVGPKIVGALNSMAESGMTVEEAMKDVRANSNIVDLDAAKNAEKFNDTMGRVGAVLQQVMTDAITPLLPLLTRLADDLLANMPLIIENVKSAFEKMQPALTALGKFIGEVLVPALKLAWAAFEVFLDIIGPIYEVGLPALSKAIILVGQVVEGVVDAFKGFIQGIMNIDELVGEMFEKFKEVGGQIIAGVLQGIKDGAGQVKDAVKNMATGALDAVKEKLGIKSPSREFAEIGVFMMQGLVVGINEGKSQVYSELDAVVADVETKTNEIADSFGSAIQRGMENGKLELSDFKDFFTNTMAELATQALGGAGAMGGTAGSIGGIIASSLGSLFFAKGGHIGAGQAGIVGEAGPELVKGPAMVYSNSNTKSMLSNDTGGGGDNVVYSPVFNTTINPGENTSPEDARKFAQQFNATIEAKVTDTIIKMQNRRGAFQQARSY